MSKEKKAIAAIGDLHISTDSEGWLENLVSEIEEKASILALCGDLTDFGEPAEAKILLKELQKSDITVVGVLGNHDYDKGKEEEIKAILSSRVTILDGHSLEIDGIGFAGVKGFGGGFGNRMLGFFGEEAIKDFVRDSINQTLHLETALTQIRIEKKVVLLHYSPIRETVLGEASEIFPFMGSSRLEEPINQFSVSVVFHGHSHYGSLEGTTLKGIPVYNVAYPLLRKHQPKQPYKLFEI